MSDLYRKEALAHRSRALFGEVRLHAPPTTWIITLLLISFVAILLAGLFLMTIETAEGSVRLIEWLLGGGA